MDIVRGLLTSLLVCLAAAGCPSTPWLLPDGTVVGTWGGDNAGVIATDSSAHVHIGCESGYTADAIRIDGEGRFEQPGTFTVGAYPVGPGTDHRASFRGVVRNGTMTIAVVLTDTTRQFGPVAVEYGSEPRMAACPICRSATTRSAAAVAAASLRP